MTACVDGKENSRGEKETLGGTELQMEAHVQNCSQVRIQGATCASQVHTSLLMKQISFSNVYVGFEPFQNRGLGFSKLTESWEIWSNLISSSVFIVLTSIPQGHLEYRVSMNDNWHVEEKQCLLRSVPMNHADEQRKIMLETELLKAWVVRKEFDAILSPETFNIHRNAMFSRFSNGKLPY